SLAMIAGAIAVSSAVATERESASTAAAIRRECDRYGLQHAEVVRVFLGDAPPEAARREWWDWLILACAAGVFVVLGLKARVPALNMNLEWAAILAVVLVASAAVCAWGLGKATRFS
ncbi:MAG: EamA/RhaT family transporter, partial [Terracidiphilus sp.]